MTRPRGKMCFDCLNMIESERIGRESSPQLFAFLLGNNLQAIGIRLQEVLRMNFFFSSELGCADVWKHLALFDIINDE